MKLSASAVQQPVPTYNPGVFDVADMQSAMNIILTPEREFGTNERWRRETPHLIALMRDMGLGQHSLVLDYGCGIGRLSKAMIDTYGCSVIGADISASMRAFGAFYVGAERFLACHPAMLKGGGVLQSCTAAVAVWVLQHALDLQAEVDRIADALMSDDLFFVVNELGRALPTNIGWIDDKVDTKAVIASRFDLVSEGKLDPAVVGEGQSKRTFWAIYRKR